MKWLRRLLYLIMFLAGFIVASHWDYGRHFVQDQSPLYQKKAASLVDKIKDQAEKKLNNLKINK